MQLKAERLDPKTLFPQRKSFNALGTTRSTLFAAMFLGEKFDCIVTANPCPEPGATPAADFSPRKNQPTTKLTCADAAGFFAALRLIIKGCSYQP